MYVSSASWFYLCECMQGCVCEYGMGIYPLGERWQFGGSSTSTTPLFLMVIILYTMLWYVYITTDMHNTANSPSQTHTNWYRNPPLFRLTKLNTLWLWIVISNARFFLAAHDRRKHTSPVSRILYRCVEYQRAVRTFSAINCNLSGIYI